ncbi:MAG: hypothetical protein OXR73_23425 [Myxococcales bacterium]|nr:hypothetical protein [Myxococcales bacterium]
MSKVTLVSIIAVLLLASLFFAYRAFDTGVTLTYFEAEIESMRTSKKLLSRIAVSLAAAPSRSETDIEAAIRKDFSDHTLEREGDSLLVDQVGLRFKERELVEVWFIDDAPEGSEPPR